MRIFFIILFSLMALIRPVFADDLTWDQRITSGQLSNGLRYFLYDSGKDADPFNVRLIVHAGSVDEDLPSGIAHILEHMVFQSNDARGRTMHQEIESLGWRTGVQVNAVTRETETQFMVRTRPHDALDLPGSLQFLADLVMKPSLRQEDWQKERFVILEELRQTVNLAERVSRLRKTALRPGSRYVDRPTIGTHAGISRTTIDDIRQFHQSFYRASNMTLIVSGHIQPEAAQAAIERIFGTAPTLKAPNRDYLILPLKKGVNVALVQDPAGTSSQVTYALRNTMPARKTDAGQFAYLQQYFLTRLIRDAVETEAPYHRNIASSLGFVAQETTAERMILAFNAKAANHAAATDVLLETVERLRRDGLSRPGFDALMAKTRTINKNNRTAAENRTFAEWEDRIASAVLSDSVVENPGERMKRTTALLDRVTFEGLNARLRDMLSAEDQVLFYQVRGGLSVTLPDAASIEQKRQDWAQLKEMPERGPAPVQVKAATAPEWPAEKRIETSGRIVAASRKTNPEIIEWSLSNGDKVVWLVRNTADGKVYLSGQSRPGFRNRTFDSVASQAALQLFMQSGYGFWTQADYDLWAAKQKQTWSFALKEGYLDAGIATNPADLPKMLETYAATIAYGGVRQEAVDTFKEQFSASSQSFYSPTTELLYGKAEDSESAEALSMVQPAEFTRIAQAHLAMPVTWFVVGPEPDAATSSTFGKVIGAVERKPTLEPEPLLQQAGHHSSAIQVFDDNRARVEISFYSSYDWTPEASFLVSTLTPLAQQSLKKELRNVLGGIYSLEFELEIAPDKDRAIGTLAFFCAPERAKELTAAALAVLDRMPTVAGQADIAKLRTDIAFAEASRLQDPNTWLRRLALSYHRYGNAGYLERMNELGEKVTASRLQAYAKQVFRTENVAVMTKLPLPSAKENDGFAVE
ncbi:zinc protease [Agrobacterium vitis]|nr:zinc protease [Agrobacterium vitis]MBE1436690.1 zinc protease [Agrobacterium vitis]